MFSLVKQESTYNDRKRDNLYGFTCISDYPLFLKDKINQINQTITSSLDEKLYEAYEENLHITLIGLNENLLFKSKDVDNFVTSLDSLKIKKINLKLLENGLLIIEINLDDVSKKSLEEYRKKFEVLGFEYKYKENISILHSVLGVFNFNATSELSEDENKDLYKNVEIKVQELNKVFDELLNEQLDLNPKIVEFNNTELKNEDSRYCKEFDIDNYQDIILYIKAEKENKVSEFINRYKETKNRASDIIPSIEKVVFIYENKLFKNKERVKKLTKAEAINQYWQVINLKIFIHKVNDHQEYNFFQYSFPSFTEKSFDILKTDKVVFDKEVIFLMSNFYGKTLFNKNIFEKKVSFNLAKFHKEAQIKSSRFKGETYFRKTYFFDKTDFEASNFKNVSLDGVTFPKDDVISMDRTSFEQVIWSDFVNSVDVKKIDASRETLARLKQANSERGNYIDSNLFFAAESDKYLQDKWNKLTCRRLDVNEEDPNKKCPANIFKRLTHFPDFISFLIAKVTNNYGTNWILPLFWIGLILGFISFYFEPNKDFATTANTPKFLLVEDKQKIDISKIKNIEDEYYKTRYYDLYSYEFQTGTKQKLKDDLYVSFLYLINSSAPSFLTTNQWFVSLSGDKLALKTFISILLVYLTGAFIFALKNRTSRG